MAERDDDPIPPEHLRTVIRLCSALYWLAIVLAVAVVCGAVAAGYIGAAWYVAIPTAAVAIFLSRVLKRFFRSVIDTARSDLLHLEGFNELRGPLSQAAGALPLVLAIMMFVAAFWYGLGMSARLLVQS